MATGVTTVEVKLVPRTASRKTSGIKESMLVPFHPGITTGLGGATTTATVVGVVAMTGVARAASTAVTTA